MSTSQDDFDEGLSLKDFLNLSAQDQQILNWIRQQGKTSLLELSVHFCHDEETTFRQLVPLVKQGYLLQRQGEDDLYYQVQSPPKRPKKIPLKLTKIKKENP